MILASTLDQQLNLTRETNQLKKKIDDGDVSENCDVIVIMANLEQSRSWILDA